MSGKFLNPWRSYAAELALRAKVINSNTDLTTLETDGDYLYIGNEGGSDVLLGVTVCTDVTVTNLTADDVLISDLDFSDAVRIEPLEEVKFSTVSSGAGTYSFTVAHRKDLVAHSVDKATDKATPVDADLIGITDSADSKALKKLSFANLRTWVQGVINAMSIITGGKSFTGQMQATSQAANDGDSLMTLELGDARYGQVTITTEPTPDYTSGVSNKAFIQKYWNIPKPTISVHFGIAQIQVLFYHLEDTPSLQISPVVNIDGSSQGVFTGDISGESVTAGRFSTSINGNNYLLDTISGRLKLGDSGVATTGYRYRFDTDFAASAGDVVVMSPSGHSFVVDRDITDATVLTNYVTGGVFVRNITDGTPPTTSDTSLTVNGGASITTTYEINSATGTGVEPYGLLFWSSTGFHVWTTTAGGSFGLVSLTCRDAS